MANIPLTIACGKYDRMSAIADGTVRVEGADATYIAIKSGPEIFSRMIRRREFDVSEMSLSTYMSERARGAFPFVAIPVFPSKVFRHGYIFVNKNSNIQSPGDLKGRRVGMTGYGQTAAVWIRGILADEYGLDLRSIHWLDGGREAISSGGKTVKFPEGIAIEPISADISMSDLLAQGQIDAMFGARYPTCFGTNADIARLFPNYREVELEYYRRTGVFPIMHTIVMREELYQANPWLASSLFKAFTEAKNLANSEMRFSGAMKYALPWLHYDLDEIDEVFGGDAFSYGVEKNRSSLTALARYLHNQGFLDRPNNIDDFFVPVIFDKT